MIYVENAEPEPCVICGKPLTYFKPTGWHCRDCDDDDG